MIKYIPSLTDTVIEEIPDRVTLAVEISNCRGNCPGCHSPFLRDDIGEELTASAIDKLLEDNFGINCFLFLGEGCERAFPRLPSLRRGGEKPLRTSLIAAENLSNSR